MKKTCLPILFLMIMVAGCSKDEIKIDPDNLLIGVWNYSEYRDNSSVFTRNDQFILGSRVRVRVRVRICK